MITRKKWPSLFLAASLLLSLFPVQALAANALTENLRPAAAQDWSAEKAPDFTAPIYLIPLGASASEQISPLSAAPPNTIAAIFPDLNLAQAVAARFVYQGSNEGATVNSRVTQENLSKIEVLDASGRNIQNLQGLQFLSALTALNLSENRISNLAPLAGLHKLTILALDDNQIIDLQPLSNLTNLELLLLIDNEIINLQPLSGLTDLKVLGLADNNIADIQALSGLIALEALALAFNHISDLRPLDQMQNMADLWVEGQEITLPPVMLTNPLLLVNQVFNIDGSRVSPVSASPAATYQTPYLRWTGLSEEVALVMYGFDEAFTLGSASCWFHGFVRQTVMLTPFVDVAREAWFHDAVRFVSEQSLMSGVSYNLFAPHVALDRAAVTAVLFRMYHGRQAGPTDLRDNPFADVPEEAWFAPYVSWAAQREIAQGRPWGDFDPEGSISREEFALMLWRYAAHAGYDMRAAEDFPFYQFPDYGSVSPWAEEALRWAGYQEIIRGTSTAQILDPGGGATRAECATMLQRFIERFG